MSTSAIGGSGSMIDVNGIVSGLMAIEQRPLQSIKTQISATQVSVSSLSEVKGLLSAAHNAAKALTSASLLRGKSVASSNEALVKASVTDPTLAGVSSIAIAPVELAKAQRSTLAGFGSATGELDATQFGTLTIDFPGTSTLLPDADRDGQPDSVAPVQIQLGGRTLTQIRDDINQQLAGKVNASIINTGDPARGFVLSLTGAKTGVDAGFSVALDADTLTARQSSGIKLGAALAAQASEAFGIVVDPTEQVPYDTTADDAYAELYAGTGNAITVRSASNVFSSAVPGVQFELLKKPGLNEATSATLAITENAAEIEAKLTSFASAFTDLLKRLQVLTKPGSSDQKAGALASNSGVLSLTSALQSSYFKGLTLSDARTYTTPTGNVIGAANNPIGWSSLGLKLARDGTVSLDASALRATLDSGLGASIRQGFNADIMSVFNAYVGSGSGLQTTIQTIELSLSSLKTRQSEAEARLERTRQGLVRKYSALDAKLVQMNQMSTNVRSALAGLSG